MMRIGRYVLVVASSKMKRIGDYVYVSCHMRIMENRS